MYARHHYRQISEYGSTVVIYIPTKEYKYTVITEQNSILHEYYITRGCKSKIYKGNYKVQKHSWRMLTSYEKES